MDACVRTFVCWLAVIIFPGDGWQFVNLLNATESPLTSIHLPPVLLLFQSSRHLHQYVSWSVVPAILWSCYSGPNLHYVNTWYKHKGSPLSLPVRQESGMISSLHNIYCTIPKLFLLVRGPLLYRMSVEEHKLYQGFHFFQRPVTGNIGGHRILMCSHLREHFASPSVKLAF